MLVELIDNEPLNDTIASTAPKVLFKEATLPTKTPAKTASGQSAFKTSKPRLDAAPQQSEASLAMFKTPSPGLLRRRQRGSPGATAGLDFGGFMIKPTSLKNQNQLTNEEDEESELEKVEPTLLELLQAKLDGIDENEEVESAGTSARDFGRCLASLLTAGISSETAQMLT